MINRIDLKRSYTNKTSVVNDIFHKTKGREIKLEQKWHQNHLFLLTLVNIDFLKIYIMYISRFNMPALSKAVFKDVQVLGYYKYSSECMQSLSSYYLQNVSQQEV